MPYYDSIFELIKNMNAKAAISEVSCVRRMSDDSQLPSCPARVTGCATANQHCDAYALSFASSQTGLEGHAVRPYHYNQSHTNDRAAET